MRVDCEGILASEAGLASWSLWATASSSHWTIFSSMLAADIFSPEDCSSYTWGNGKSTCCSISQECLAVGENKQTEFCVEREEDIKTFVSLCQYFLTWLSWNHVRLVLPIITERQKHQPIISSLLLFAVCDSEARASCWTLLCFLWVLPSCWCSGNLVWDCSTTSGSQNSLVPNTKAFLQVAPVRALWKFYNNAMYFLPKAGLQGRNQEVPGKSKSFCQ